MTSQEPIATSESQAAEGVFAHWPNRITMLRFVVSLLLFALLALRGSAVPESMVIASAAFWLFIVTAVSDFFDGYLARKGNFVTAFGRIADPFVDKVLVLGSMIFLATESWSSIWFPAWIVVVVLAREFLVTGIRGYVESQGMEFGADGFGKLKMVTQCIAIGIVLGQHAFPWPEVIAKALVILGHVFVWITLVTSLGSGVTYVLKTRDLLQSKARQSA